MEGRVLVEEGALLVEYVQAGLATRVGRKADSSARDAAVAAVREELAQIVGLQPVKDYILSLEDNFKIQQLRRERGLKADSPSMHMIFTGNPGTGKTTVARIVSRYLKAIGVLEGGQLVEVTRSDLVGQYVPHRAPHPKGHPVRLGRRAVHRRGLLPLPGQGRQLRPGGH